MRLRQGRVQGISRAVAQALLQGGYLEGVSGEPLVLIVRGIIERDLKVEDELEEEVRRIIEGHRQELDRGRIPYHTMFKMIKDKLARERKLIL